MTLGLRHLLNPAGWGLIAGVIELVGIAYLGQQYLFLREHLKDKRENITEQVVIVDCIKKRKR